MTRLGRWMGFRPWMSPRTRALALFYVFVWGGPRVRGIVERSMRADAFRDVQGDGDA